MDLRRLRHVCMLARVGSYVRAAKELHITQSALSRSVQLLEAELQIRIFDRGRGGVRVTDVGRVLIDRAGSILLAVAGLQHDLGLASCGEFGEVRFGLGPLPASAYLPGLLAELACEHRSLRVTVEVNNASVLLESLQAERIEFCICPLTLVPTMRSMTAMPLTTLPISVYARAGHPLAARALVKLRDLMNYPVITGNMTAEAADNLRRAANLPAGEPFPITITCDDFSLLKSVVINSDALWLTSSAALMEELVAGEVVELACADFKPQSADLNIVSVAGRSLSPAAQLVISKIREQDLRRATGALRLERSGLQSYALP